MISISISDAIALAGLLIVGLSTLGGVYWRLISEIRKSEDRCAAAADQRQVQRDGDKAELHHRINEIQERYVRRDDHDAHVARVERQMDRLLSELQGMRNDVSTRIDVLVTALKRPEGGRS